MNNSCIVEHKLEYMDERPKIKLALTAADKMIEVAGWTGIAAIWLLTVAHYSQLPDTIPIHYDGSGRPDGFGSKGAIVALPVIATILFIGLTMLNRVPHLFNYPTAITKENALIQYTYATRMIRYLKFIIVAVSGYIVLKTIQAASSGKISGLIL